MGPRVVNRREERRRRELASIFTQKLRGNISNEIVSVSPESVQRASNPYCRWCFLETDPPPQMDTQQSGCSGAS